MSMKLIDDIRSVTELKRKTRGILDQVRQSNMAKLLAPAEDDVRAGRTRAMSSFLRDFKRSRKISS